MVKIKGCTYSLFTTDDGEVMSGGCDINLDYLDEDEFFEFISKEFVNKMKKYLKINPNKLFVFTLQFEGEQ